MKNLPEKKIDDQGGNVVATAPSKKRSSHALVLTLGLVAIGLIALLMLNKVEVGTEAEQSKATNIFSNLIQVHADQASRRNINALKLFEVNINRIVKEHEKKLSSAAQQAAKEAADYGSCCKIVYYMAWDKVKGQHETEAYLNREIKPFLDPSTEAFSKDVDAALQKLIYDLQKSTVQLANDLAAIAPVQASSEMPVDLETMSRSDFQQSLRNLGFNATGIVVSVGFDAVALSKTQLFPVLWKKISAIGTRMFGKQVAKLAGSATIAAADGPSPVGKIIALGGVIWTGYDIYASQKEFETEIRTSLSNLLADANNDMQKQAIEQATEQVRHHQKLQDDMGSQMLDHVAMVSN